MGVGTIPLVVVMHFAINSNWNDNYVWVNRTLLVLAIANIPGHVFLSPYLCYLESNVYKEFYEKKHSKELFFSDI